MERWIKGGKDSKMDRVRETEDEREEGMLQIATVRR